MILGRYQLLAQLGAGRDGVSYRAADPTAATVEVRILKKAGSEDEFKRLLKRLRLAAMLEHPVALGIRELCLDHEPPYLALEWRETRYLAEALRPDVPLPEPVVAEMGRDLCAALAAAHRLGLAHGKLRRTTIGLTDEGGVAVDFTGLEVTPPVLASEEETFCRPPELPINRQPDPAGDVFSLAGILFWLLTGSSRLPPASSFTEFVGVWQECLPLMLARDPADRPPAREMFDQLNRRLGGTVVLDFAQHMTTAWSKPAADPDAMTLTSFLSGRLPESIGFGGNNMPRLGRFRLLEKLGEGGLGAVYRAEDVTDGTIVAIKMLHGRWNNEPRALQRLQKEARLLAEVNNPYVANLIEMNEDQGIHYLVLEFVSGRSLSSLLSERQRLEEPLALAIMADVARALVGPHQRGIVHRDIKPENILLDIPPSVSEGGVKDGAPKGATPLLLNLPAIKVKVCDFGVARHVLQSESLNVTQPGSAVGTPLYASPEQWTGEAVDPRTDVYGMGGTLFHLLAGRPPFMVDSALALRNFHANEAPPSLQQLNPVLSEGVCRIVEKALAKHPDGRYADAEAFLNDLERVLRGEPTSIGVHPRLPDCDPKRLVQFNWTWELEASPEQLWPHVSNTDRLNRAVGIPAVQFTTQQVPTGGRRHIGQFRKAGFTNTWHEHPFEWIEGRRMGVLREYSQGVFKWLATMTEMKPRADGGTTLTHQVRIEPRGVMGRLVAKVEVGVRGRRSVERVYRRIDAFVKGKLGGKSEDPFEGPVTPSLASRRRLDLLLDHIIRSGVEPAVAEQVGEFLLNASPQEVARIRPLVLAQRLGLDPDQVVAACLHGAREGLLVLLWDILCPVCRIPSAIKDSLRSLGEHGHCEACDLNFKLDFANSVEMMFRAHPQIRASDLGVYCIGGPAHSPHVLAQIRVGVGERIELELGLTEGAYRVRGPQLPFTLDFRVQSWASMARWDLHLARGIDPVSPQPLKNGQQLLVITNEFDQELLVRVERVAPRDDALTAARASTLALFRELFPGEILLPGQLVSVATVTLLVTDLDQAEILYEQLGDGRAFALIHEHFCLLNNWIREGGGAMVKTVGEGVVAAFPDPVAAVRLGLDLPERLSRALEDRLGETTPPLGLRLAVHQGAALAATINDHLDYFGTMVNQAAQLPALIHGNEMVLTQAVTGDPQVAALLRQRHLDPEVLLTSLPGQQSLPLHRLVLRSCP